MIFGLSRKTRRRSLELGVPCVLVLLAVSAAGNEAQAGTTDPATARSSSRQGDHLNVVYIGGSITKGAFASTPDKSYASLLTAWLKTRYHQVQARNLGVGGTGSEFATYRLRHDLEGFVPDLAFLEFSVNDAGNTRPKILAQVDALVHQLRVVNPRVKIVYISTTDVGEEPYRRAGRHAGFVEDSIAVAAIEDIPFIDAATGLWGRILSGTPASTYLNDNVHPNDAGHALYFESIRDALAPLVPLRRQPSIHGSKYIERSNLQTARLEPVSAATGCSVATLPMKYMEKALSCTQGQAFTYRFSGTTIGMIQAMVHDGGRMDCTIDGTNPKPVDFYDAVVAIYERPFPLIVYRGLRAGDHVLSCRTKDTLISLPSGTSQGHKASIGYFMVSDERPMTMP
jgi:lysophospholipase L1-like esterase